MPHRNTSAAVKQANNSALNAIQLGTQALNRSMPNTEVGSQPVCFKEDTV